MRPILITGASGLVGTALVRAGGLGLTRQELNIVDEATVAEILDAHSPAAVINAAAQANVNRAESEPDWTMRVNGHGPGVLARACAERGIRFVHLSTDYVLEHPEGMLTEEHLPSPRSIYATSKLMGERVALSAGAVVVRIQWVYDPGTRGFFNLALRRLVSGAPLKLVTDQVGIPTPASVLAPALLSCACRGPVGLFHLACQGETSAWDWIAHAAACVGIPLDAQPVTRAELGGAWRPSRSCLSSDKFFSTWGIRLPQWNAALDEVLLGRTPDDWIGE